MLLKNSFVNQQINVLCFTNDNVKLLQTIIKLQLTLFLVWKLLQVRNLKNMPDGFLQNQSHCDNGRRR